MNEKHIKARIAQCLAIAECSSCPKRQFGALIIDPASNVVLVDAYNGPPRGGAELCGGHECLRQSQQLQGRGGCNVEVGCHHAEMNAICNAARNGVRTEGAWLIVNGEPCLMCAKLLHHAGITRVICVLGGWGRLNGVQYLREHGVQCDRVTVEGTSAE